ncbi:MAG: lysine--tRNA ligase, partial [DPANN group archaeon]|nr:lysine--tRNA ligase [DPANN group archaeon]
MENQGIHWADQIAKEVEERVAREPDLQRIVKEKGYIVLDEKTPSGKIHIGSGRGWIIHDAIAKALRARGLKGRFILSADDFDPFDKMNADLPPAYEKYMGMPFRDIPSPVEGYESFADYYFRQSTDKFKEFGIEAELDSTARHYIDGDFDRAIKKALDESAKIDAVYERIYGSAPKKLPFNPVCEKCGRIGTTRAISWDPEKEMVRYRCEENLVKWAKGCGHEGERSPYKGGGKLPWKVEWAAKWPVFGVVCEWAGKDHFSHSGSREVSIAIADAVYDFPPPWPSTRKKTGKGYEFFNIGGKKMSTSQGRGIGFAESTDYAPAEMLRYLLIATRPHAVIDFDPVGKNDLILLYERFDRTERIYFGKEQPENEHEVQKHRRIYELSNVGKVPSKMPPQVPFLSCSVVIQAALGNIEKAISLLQKYGQIPQKLDAAGEAYIQERLRFAKHWIDTHADEQFRFTVQDKVAEGIVISEPVKKALKELAKTLAEKDWEEQELFDATYAIINRNNLSPRDFYTAAYRVLINKEKGPKLAGFILTIGKE